MKHHNFLGDFGNFLPGHLRLPAPLSNPISILTSHQLQLSNGLVIDSQLIFLLLFQKLPVLFLCLHLNCLCREYVD